MSLRFLLLFSVWLVGFYVSPSFSASLKIMSLNVLADEYTDASTGSPADSFGRFPFWSERLGLVGNIISQATPDIFGLQEDSQKQRDDLAVLVASEYEFAAFPNHQSQTYGGALSLGTIFFKRSLFNLVEAGTFPIGGARNATWVVLLEKRTQQEWLFINVHLYGGSSLGQLTRIEAYSKKKLGSRKLVVLGDFNNTPDKLTHLTHALNLRGDNGDKRQVLWAGELSFNRSSSSLSRAEAIDHIYSDQKISRHNAETTFWYSKSSNSSAKPGYYPIQSDHGAVMIELLLKPPLASSKNIAKKIIPIITHLLSD